METLSPADKRNLLLTGEIPAAALKTATVAQTQPKTAKEVVKEPVVEARPAGASGRTLVNTPVLAKGSGLYYRVQLSANSKPFDAQEFYGSSGVVQEVFVEQHKGLYKYTAGSYTSYNEAVSYKELVENLPGVIGAFVVAYKDGKRIPVSSDR